MHRPLITLDESEVFDEATFEQDLATDDLQTALKQHGPVYWKYGKLHALALRLRDMADLNLQLERRNHETLMAKLNETYRNQMTEAGAKTTEKAIETKVLLDEAYLESLESMEQRRRAQIELDFQVSIAALAEKVMSKRTEILITLGHLLRGERGSETATVLSTQAAARGEYERLRQQAAPLLRGGRKKES